MPSSEKTIVLFDGHCGLCRRTIKRLKSLDWFCRLQYIDIHDAAARKAVAPERSYRLLNESMHVRLPNGSYRSGYRALRALAWKLPLAWLSIPLLYIPGAAIIGERMYKWMAASRGAHGGECKL